MLSGLHVGSSLCMMCLLPNVHASAQPHPFHQLDQQRKGILIASSLEGHSTVCCALVVQICSHSLQDARQAGRVALRNGQAGLGRVGPACNR